MSILVSLRHRTEYHFDRPVTLSPHVIRLRPASHSRTPIKSYSLAVEPKDHFINWQQDAFGNYLARLVFNEVTEKLTIDVNLVAEMTVINPFDFFLEPRAQRYPFEYSEQEQKELTPYFEIRDQGPLLRDWVASIATDKTPTLDFLVDLNRRLQQEVNYIIRMQPGVQSCEETLEMGQGSCRDSAWLLVQILRHLGLASRFVSGYLVQLKADQKSLDGPSGTEQDFTDLHAWTEVYVPGAGWIGLDPTSGLAASEGHIPLACTADYISAAPVVGAIDKCEVEFSYLNEVHRIRETPRVTKPYDEAQWQAIQQLGERIDGVLQAEDVRLTMGGEPTFVSIDDMDGEQWSTQALGADKRARAEVLLKRLHQRFAPHGVLQETQGKWYPGEVLPRWALHCFWRTDGEPLWRNPELLADQHRPTGADAPQAEAFIRAFAERLGVDDEHVQAAYEDLYYYLWKEGTLPENIRPQDNRLEDETERKRLMRVFEQGLDKVSGYVLPIRHGRAGWHSGAWVLKRGHLFLLPGDSPMGLRLPLDALRFEEQPDYPVAQDPFEERPELTEALKLQRAFRQGLGTPNDDRSATQSADSNNGPLVRTALCVEPRQGTLHVFLPPVDRLEQYIELISCIEAVAESLNQPLIIEGYQPPKDPRLKHFSVTPDPGVIEVNIHPSANWSELVDNTETLYEEARLSRLGTEKFMLDGRHTGTGGGNHVTIGGPSAADSPVLRRPDLLTSFVMYWQNHPSLSYLFSGMFIGPTSQAPRVDEARDDMLYELEIARRQMPEGEVLAPWLVDRLLRNLLVDVTGNTHRAEFCIDKLYNPNGPMGRHGLLEFRAFEMPPHAQMSSLQMLLLRGLIARFWRQPYQQAPVRWGTELHDRFMLPHFVQRDLEDVLADLQSHGYGFEKRWFDPFLEFRFPKYGSRQINDVEMELRFAIEPWHVLGEEVSSFGTARFVDSSVERLQVKVRGLTPGRHIVTCNGHRVPLRATGIGSEQVAGVRYKAWNPPSSLHPRIAAQSPLIFDLLDTWNGMSLGGCTYHVSHPGGRGYDIFPVNANEAEARRRSRFWQHGQSPGKVAIPADQSSEDFPYTLDLRYRTH